MNDIFDWAIGLGCVSLNVIFAYCFFKKWLSSGNR